MIIAHTQIQPQKNAHAHTHMHTHTNTHTRTTHKRTHTHTHTFQVQGLRALKMIIAHIKTGSETLVRVARPCASADFGAKTTFSRCPCVTEMIIAHIKAGTET